MLGIVIAVAHAAQHEEANLVYLTIFIMAFFTFFFGKRYFLIMITTEFEKCAQKIRLRIADKIRKNELIYLENMGIGDIFTQITKNTEVVSMVAISVALAFQSVFVLFCCLIYLAMLSKVAFIATLFIAVPTTLLYLYYQRSVSDYINRTMEMDGRFCNMLYDTLKGFKELKINQKKSRDYFEILSLISEETEELKVETEIAFVTKSMFSDSSAFILLAMVAFLLPHFGGFDEIVVQALAGVLFIMGPINTMAGGIPNFLRMEVSLGAVYDLERRLDEASQSYIAETKSRKTFDSFEEIRFDNVLFQYGNEDDSFSLGPMSFSVRKGETLFIVGGNGSGKSTMLKLLTGLYYPKSGWIRADNKIIDKETYPAYRELFSVIFTDFHLFDRLYGLYNVDYSRIRELLDIMDLSHKTKIVDGVFTNIQLSTGQRKRLAMIVALLENRKICIFDEWAADQDPIFREYFYETLLKSLKKQGKTIIAVSHDDRYFDCADRVLKMEMGQFVTVKKD